MNKLVFGKVDSAKRARFYDILKRFVVLLAWIGIYVAFYFVTTNSPATPPTKAQQVDRLGLLPPSLEENIYFKKGAL